MCQCSKNKTPLILNSNIPSPQQNLNLQKSRFGRSSFQLENNIEPSEIQNCNPSAYWVDHGSSCTISWRTSDCVWHTCNGNFLYDQNWHKAGCLCKFTSSI